MTPELSRVDITAELASHLFCNPPKLAFHLSWPKKNGGSTRIPLRMAATKNGGLPGSTKKTEMVAQYGPMSWHDLALQLSWGFGGCGYNRNSERLWDRCYLIAIMHDNAGDQVGMARDSMGRPKFGTFRKKASFHFLKSPGGRFLFKMHNLFFAELHNSKNQNLQL
jgi:hypothetical protein